MVDERKLDLDTQDDKRDSIDESGATELDDLVNKNANGNRNNNEHIKPLVHIDNNEPYSGDDTKSDKVTSVNYKLTKWQAIINLLILSSAFMVMFSGMNTFVSVQSTLNKEEGLGTTGLTVLYSTAFVTNLFLPVVLSLVGSKLIITVSIATYIAYVATGYYSAWSTVIPGAIVIGVGSPHLWVASQAYITDLVKYSKSSGGKPKPEKVTMFFGVFFALHASSRIWGNLYSSFVLRGRGEYNHTAPVHDTRICGAWYCPGVPTNNTNLNPPSTEKITIYTTICIGCIALAILGSLFLRNLPLVPHMRVSVCGRITNVFKHMFTCKTQLYLLAITVFRSVSRVFIDGDYTVAFVSCTIGVENVGFVMIAYGSAATLFSFIGGRMCKYTGELILFIIGFVVQIAVCLTMLLWEPTREQSVAIYVIAALWGLADAVYAPTLTGLYSTFFTKNRDTAFTAFRFLDAFGFALAYAYSGYVCTDLKIYIILAFIALSCGCVVGLLRNKNKHYQ